MDLVRILNELWDRRRWVVAAAVVALLAGISTSYKLPSFEKKAQENGAASAQALIDSTQSTIGDVERDPTPLAARAVVLAQYMSSPEARTAIAKRMGLSPQQISAEGPFSTLTERSSYQAIPAGPRANQLTEEDALYRLVFDAQLELPIVSIYAQGPTADGAAKLAASATATLRSYVAGLDKGVPRENRITATTLGAPEGGIVNSSASPVLAVLAFLGTFILLCVLIVVGSGLTRQWRLMRRSAADASSSDDVVPHPILEDRQEVPVGVRSSGS